MNIHKLRAEGRLRVLDLFFFIQVATHQNTSDVVIFMGGPEKRSFSGI